MKLVGIVVHTPTAPNTSEGLLSLQTHLKHLLTKRLFGGPGYVYDPHVHMLDSQSAELGALDLVYN